MWVGESRFDVNSIVSETRKRKQTLHSHLKKAMDDQTLTSEHSTNGKTATYCGGYEKDETVYYDIRRRTDLQLDGDCT